MIPDNEFNHYSANQSGEDESRTNYRNALDVTYTFDIVAPNIPEMKQSNNDQTSLTWQGGTTQSL
jgi:hypothetical protein